MSEAKFKTMRHIETVRNYLTKAAAALLYRGQGHDQSKLQPPEAGILEEYTPKLRDCTYGSDEYRKNMEGMAVMIEHHNRYNRHHPEHFKNGVRGMNLLDLVEMVIDWKAATMRHGDGDIYTSLEINAKRHGYGDELKEILLNTVKIIESWDVKHRADES